MTELSRVQNARRLSEEEVDQYKKSGYRKNLSLFDPDEVQTLQKEFMEMVQRVPDSTGIYRFNNWHQANRWSCGLGRTAAIPHRSEA